MQQNSWMTKQTLPNNNQSLSKYALALSWLSCCCTMIVLCNCFPKLIFVFWQSRQRMIQQLELVVNKQTCLTTRYISFVLSSCHGNCVIICSSDTYVHIRAVLLGIWKGALQTLRGQVLHGLVVNNSSTTHHFAGTRLRYRWALRA